MKELAVNLKKRGSKGKKIIKNSKAFSSPKGTTGQCDFLLTFFTTILVIFGVVMVFSASYYYSISREGTPYAYLIKQIVYGAVGFVLMYVMSRFDYHLFRRYSLIIVLLNIIMLMLLFTPLGTTVNGATRWLRIGISVMPGEIAKFSIIIFSAVYLSADINRAKNLSGMLPLLGVVGIFALLIMKQPNLSTAMTLVFIAGGMMVLAGMPWKYSGTAIGGIVVLALMKGFMGGGYQRARMLSFLDPFAQAQGDGFQVVQSLLALGTGGVFGVGLGRSVQKTLYLPEPHTDFIMAIIGEELGLVGIIGLVVVFMLAVWRCMAIAMDASDRLGMLLAGGVGIMIGIQLIFNIAIVTSSMPPTGVALPFISYGGNSLWIFMALMGVVLNVSRQSRKEVK